jgi:hypothetical protein
MTYCGRRATTTAMALDALLIAGCGVDGEPVAGAEGPRRAGAAVPVGVAGQSRQIEEEIRSEGGEQRVRPWRLAYIAEPAEPWSTLRASMSPRQLRRHGEKTQPPALAEGARAVCRDVRLGSER